LNKIASISGARTCTQLNPLLKQVSRSFYLTLRVLPRAVRSQIALAYLLARATDTVADTRLVTVEERLAALAALRARILGQSFELPGFSRFVDASEKRSIGSTPSAAERVLLLRIDEFLSCLSQLSPPDLALVRNVLSTIVSGQELDLRRFSTATPTEIIALENENELDDYTYRVAGCVGEFWTRICRAHIFPEAPLDEKALLENGVRFGKGLQLVNILRDLPADLLVGRCYLPLDRLKSCGLAPVQLLDMNNYERLRPLYCELLATAESHLEAGWLYTNSLPRRALRVRLACAWPILIGV